MADTSLDENKIGLLIWKVSNYWQSKLRKILKPFNLSLNEFLILESIYELSLSNSGLSQNEISKYNSIDVTVASVTFKLLENKRLISRLIKNDNRKKIIVMLKAGESLFNKIYPLIQKEQELIFNKLQNETFNFTNSLKLLLGKKIRIKADKII